MRPRARSGAVSVGDLALYVDDVLERVELWRQRYASRPAGGSVS